MIGHAIEHLEAKKKRYFKKELSLIKVRSKIALMSSMKSILKVLTLFICTLASKLDEKKKQDINTWGKPNSFSTAVRSDFDTMKAI